MDPKPIGYAKRAIDPIALLDWIGRIQQLVWLAQQGRKIVPGIIRELASPRMFVNAAWVTFYLPWTRKPKRLIPVYPLACVYYGAWSLLHWLKSLNSVHGGRPSLVAFNTGSLSFLFLSAFFLDGSIRELFQPAALA